MFRKLQFLKQLTRSLTSSSLHSSLPKSHFSLLSGSKPKYSHFSYSLTFKPLSSIHNIFRNNYKEDLTLLTGVSREDLTLYNKVLDKYTSCNDYSLLTDEDKHIIFPLFQNLAYAHHNENNEESSFRYLLETQQLCEKLDFKDSFYAANNNYMLAIIYAGRLEYPKAEHCFQEVRRIAHLLSTNPEVANIYVNCLSLLGKIYSHQERFDEAIETFNLALGLTEKVNKEQLPSFLIIIYQEMALIYSHCREFEKALECNKKGLEMMLNNNEGEQGTIPENFYGDIAANLSALNRSTEALPYAKKALKIAQSRFAKDSLELAGAYDLLARVYHLLSEYPKALELYKKATKIYVKDSKGNAKALCVMYLEMMEIYRSMEEHQNAINLFNKEIKGFIERRLVPDEKSIAILYAEFGNILKENEETFQDAERYYKKAIEIYGKIEESPAILDLLYSLSELAFRREDFDEALKHLKEYERLQTEEDMDLNKYETVCGFIGEICFRKGNFDESLEYCQKALQVCESREEAEQQFLSTHCINLGRVYEQKGMLEEALESYQRGLLGGQNFVSMDHENIKAIAARVIWLANKLQKPVQQEIFQSIFGDSPKEKSE